LQEIIGNLQAQNVAIKVNGIVFILASEISTHCLSHADNPLSLFFRLVFIRIFWLWSL